MTILLVDDDPLLLKSIGRALRREGYTVLPAASAQEALGHARDHLIDLVVCDVRMPDVDGLDTLGALRNLQQGVRSIVITGYASEDAPIRAIKHGVDDYLFKPLSLETLLRSIRHSLELRRLELETRDTVAQLRRRYLRVITALVKAVQDRDPHYQGHAQRVAALSVDLGSELGLDPVQLDRLELSALLHDLSMLLAESDLVKSAEKLADEVLSGLREQAPAREILRDLPDFDEVVHLLEGVRERYDGSGPKGLKGEEIPLESRIIAVTEAFDSLVHQRPHRPALAPSDALAVLAEAGRTQFDPAVVSLFADVVDEVRSLSDPRGLLERGLEMEATLSRFQAVRNLGNLFRDTGEVEAAETAYREAEQLLTEGLPESLSPLLLADRAILAARRGDQKSAVAIASKARRELVPGPRGVDVLLSLARLFLDLGRYAQAREVLDEAERLGPDPASGRVLTLLALETARRTPDREAFARLYPGWVDSFPPGYLESLEPGTRREVARLFLAALSVGLVPEASRAALARLVEGWPALLGFVRQTAPSLDLSFLEEAPAPRDVKPAARAGLEVRLFGRFRVECEGKTLPSKAWSTRKSQELFAFLVLQGRPVSSSRVLETLWPETAETSRQNLHTTVSRVRRALRACPGLADRSAVGSDRDFYFLEPDLELWVDVREFEHRVRSVRECDSAVLPAAVLLDCQRAIELSTGELLEGTWESWVVELRTTYSEQALWLLDRLGRHHLERGEPDLAAACFEQILEKESLREEAYLGLMRCYAAQNKREAAVRRFQEYSRLLSAELALEPSPEALALYQELTS